MAKRILPSMKEIREAEKAVAGIENIPERKMSLKETIGKVKVKKKQGPVWEGPCSDGSQGGITFSLLSRWLVCRERFRLLVIEGLKPRDQFNSRLEFGNMWHLCEQAFAAGYAPGASWQELLLDYCKELCLKYSYSRDEINNWYGICATMFPLYLDHRSKHPDTAKRIPLMQEEKFCVPYKLPSGRTVYLRGKMDGVDLVKGLVIHEIKTKGDPDKEQIERQLRFDLQTMMYPIVLEEGICPTCRGQWTPEKAKFLDESPTNPCPNCVGDLFNPHVTSSEWKPRQGFPVIPLEGVRYDVIKRPRQYQGKKETHQEFLERLKGIIEEKPDEFFMRWDVQISTLDTVRFKHECFNPILENVCDDYEWWEHCKTIKTKHPDPLHDDEHRRHMFSEHMSRHFRLPFGVYNVLAEGGSADLDNYLATGSEVGLTRTTDLFPELA